MKILVIEPFYTESHKKWLDGLIEFSSHDITSLTLPGFHWKWRMHGAAITLADEYRKKKCSPNLIICTDMLDVNVFQACLREIIQGIPIVMYFHENQISYPWSPTDQDVTKGRDRHYGWINYTSALNSDHLFFNSEYHRHSFISGLRNFLREFPDYQNMETVADIESKSSVLPLGLDLSRFDEVSGTSIELSAGPKDTEAPIILWNHRWEYDKNPDLFFTALFQLKEEGYKFKLIVCGKSYPSSPPIFAEAKERLSDEIIYWGYAQYFREYAQLLWAADLLPVTSHQDFFGISVVEAIYCKCFPLLPRRLAYPEHVKEQECFYDTDDDFYRSLQVHLKRRSYKANIDLHKINSYDWTKQISQYDATFSTLYSRFTHPS